MEIGFINAFQFLLTSMPQKPYYNYIIVEKSRFYQGRTYLKWNFYSGIS